MTEGKMMKRTPYLNFNGQCEEAFRFYENCLGGKILFKMTYGESPMPPEATPPGWGGKILHATLAVGDQLLQGSDSPAEHKARGFAISIGLADAAEAERIFAALADGGTVGMPIQETFWALRFGMVTDRFGTPWMINCEKPA
jgi:PhnB protein